MRELVIKRAEKSDHILLSDIAFTAKRYWKYPEKYFNIWQKELTITPGYIFENIVYKSVFQGKITGFYSIVENKNDYNKGNIFVQKGFWLEHRFVLPSFHKKGIGRELINHAKSVCIRKDIDRLLIFVDPYAKGFYEKIGAEYLYDSPSSIQGRNIPVYLLIVQTS